MKKIISIIFTMSYLVGSYIYYDTEKLQEEGFSIELNDEHIKLYEQILTDRNLQDQRRVAYKDSYRTFLLHTSTEFLESDPRSYEGLID